MQIKSKPLTDTEVALLQDLLRDSHNDPKPASGVKAGRVLAITDTTPGPDGTVVTVSFDDQRGIDVDYLKLVIGQMRMLHIFSFAPSASGRLRLVQPGFRGEGAVALIADGTRYEMEVDSSVRWAINVRHMPSPRLRRLLELIEEPVLEDVPYALINHIDAVNHEVPLRFNFHLNVRHSHQSHEPNDPHDERRRLALNEVLGITLEFAPAPVART